MESFVAILVYLLAGVAVIGLGCLERRREPHTPRKPSILDMSRNGWMP